MRYVSGPHLHTKDSFVEELFGGEERKEEESLLERPPRMPEGTLLKGVKREFLEVDVAYQKRDFAPWFTLTALLVYWVKFFVDLSGGDDNALWPGSDSTTRWRPWRPLRTNARLQTTDWRRLFTYQFVHVDAGHLVANSIILLVLGLAPRDGSRAVVGVAFEAGVVLGAVASLVFAPYQRVVGFSAGVYCVLGVHFGHLLLHWADMRRGALNRWARLLIFAVFFGVDVAYSYAEQVSATIHLAGFVVGVVLSAAVLRDFVERPRSVLRARGPRAAGRAPRAACIEIRVLRRARRPARAPDVALGWRRDGLLLRPAQVRRGRRVLRRASRAATSMTRGSSAGARRRCTGAARCWRVLGRGAFLL